MALIFCKECGKEISDTAKRCPNCGYKLIKPKNYNKPVIILIALGILFVFGFVIYSFNLFNGKPHGMSKEAYNYGIDALKVADKYIDDVYDYDKANDELDKIKNKIDSLTEENNNYTDSMISFDISLFSSSVFNGTESDILDKRNDLAKDLNEKSR